MKHQSSLTLCCMYSTTQPIILHSLALGENVLFNTRECAGKWSLKLTHCLFHSPQLTGVLESRKENGGTSRQDQGLHHKFRAVWTFWPEIGRPGATALPKASVATGALSSPPSRAGATPAGLWGMSFTAGAELQVSRLGRSGERGSETRSISD